MSKCLSGEGEGWAREVPRGGNDAVEEYVCYGLEIVG